MSRPIDILCLANSRKHSGRCVAGLRLDTGGWIRPVPAEDGGALHPEHYETENGHSPEPLDVLRIYVEEPCPKTHHPENWRLADRSWEVLSTELTVRGAKALVTAIRNNSDIFGTKGLSVKNEELVQSPALNSLALVSPTDPYFYVKEREGKKNQARAKFKLDGSDYNLAITDPRYEETIVSQNLEYAPEMDSDEAMLFTISLSEPYSRNENQSEECYKLVAGIVTVPAALLEK